MKRRILLWSFVVLWMAVIFFLSSRIGGGAQTRSMLSSLFGLHGAWLEVLNTVLRKTMHMIVYATLCILCYRALVHGHGISSSAALIGGILLSVAYACTDEYHQTFVPGRVGQFQDVLIDATGAVTGSFLYFRRSHRTKGVS